MSNNDLISREALREEMQKADIKATDYETLAKMYEKCVDNAPPVDKGYQEGYQEGHIDGVLQAEKLYARPIGKWINTSQYDDKGECSLCCYLSYRYYNFCPNCGADMKFYTEK